MFYLISGIILLYIFIYGCAMGATEISKEQQALKEQQSLDETNKDQDLEKRKKAYLELLRYDRKKEYEFWIYFSKREKGKLTYIVPEFEQRIVKMNKLRKGRR